MFTFHSLPTNHRISTDRGGACPVFTGVLVQKRTTKASRKIVTTYLSRTKQTEPTTEGRLDQHPEDGSLGNL